MRAPRLTVIAMASEQSPSDEAIQIEEEARRLHRMDAAMGGVGFFRSWESRSESTKEIYRAQARSIRRVRRGRTEEGPAAKP